MLHDYRVDSRVHADPAVEVACDGRDVADREEVEVDPEWFDFSRGLCNRVYDLIVERIIVFIYTIALSIIRALNQID